MKKNKLVFLLSLILLFSVFSIFTFAEESEVTTTDPILEERKQAILDSKIQILIKYTHDSISNTGLYYTVDIDPFTYLLTMNITTDLPFGQKIYDNPDTEIIDGIRINGETVTSLKNIPIDPTKDKYEITVKTVYADGTTGVIAKILDGTATAEDLLSNPLILFQIGYYVLAATSLIVSSIIALKSKKKKVKTANEIASAIDIRTKASQEEMNKNFMSLLEGSVLPLIQKTVDTNKAIVKAITLSTSKMKDAPISLLDTLKEISDVDTISMLEEAKESVTKNLKHAEETKANIASALKNIAESAQEDINNVQEPKEKKSVF